MSLHVLLAPFGSEGDVNPLIWMAAGLAARGHHPHFLLSPHYARLIESHGFSWTPVGTEEDFLRFARDPRIWDARRGPIHILQGMLKTLPAYRDAFLHANQRFDLVVTTSIGLAAAAMAEKNGIPRLRVHLQPACLRSIHDCPLFSPEFSWLIRSPRWVKSLFFKLVDLLIWNAALRPFNRFRRSLDLPPVRDFYLHAVHDGDGVAALFPSWFAPAQPDWPPGVRQFAFPIRPASGSLPSALRDFLASGPPPVVWTHGSANFDIAHFQSSALRSAVRTGTRCLLVSLDPPASSLPPGCFHASHVEFSLLFPHCSAVVHHGGIGTTAKAIASGIPQIIIPRSHDQPDNGFRIQRLGLGRLLPYSALDQPPVLDQALLDLLNSPSFGSTCHTYAHKLAADHPEAILDWAESLAQFSPNEKR